MRDHLDRLAPAAPVLVTFAPVDELAGYRRHLDLTFPVLTDPERNLYRSFDLRRGSVREVYGTGTIRRYASLLRRGRRLRRPTQDTLQLGGDFVLDSDRRLVAAFRPTGPADRPSIGALVEAVAAA